MFAEIETRSMSLQEYLDRTVYRPFKMLLTEPSVLITMYLAFVYGIVFASTLSPCLLHPPTPPSHTYTLTTLARRCVTTAVLEVYPAIFIGRRGMTIDQDGLMFIGMGAGVVLGLPLAIVLERGYPRLMMEWRGFPPPECRLHGAMLGGPALVVGIFWLGWTGDTISIPWYVPALSGICLGGSICLIFISFSVRAARALAFQQC